MTDTPFNPLDKMNLAQSLADALLKRPLSPLPPKKSFSGAGIYAIYSAAESVPYQPLWAMNKGREATFPIYVGKAIPPGARKGGFGVVADPGTALFSRLREHARSIEEADNLSPSDFSCRYLVCDDIWIPLGESLLIARYRPPWNVIFLGFGIHKPGKGRKKQVTSRWDTVHPGRSLAKGLPANPMSQAEIVQLVADFFAGKQVSALTPTEAVIEEEEEKDDE
jgi:hypothetical protein